MAHYTALDITTIDYRTLSHGFLSADLKADVNTTIRLTWRNKLLQ